MSKLMKWSGSKDSQADKIIENFPKNINRYIEPFCGGASIFIKLLKSNINIEKYLICDINKSLIDVYNMIKNEPQILIKKYYSHYLEFNKFDIEYRKKYFIKIRNDFNKNNNPEDFYFIMRTTTNGMPRYNKNGDFNNSCHFSRPGMKPDDVEKLILEYHILFKLNNIEFVNIDYKLININNDDFLYLDPPYENTKGMYFGKFNNIEFINWLNNLSCKWILSYDGKVNNNKIDHISPNYKRHIYLISGNSSFRRVIGNSNNSIVSESLYFNF